MSAASQPGRSSSDRGAARAPRPRTKHGNKTDYLFGALPPAPAEFRGRPPTPDRAGSRPSDVPKSSSMRSVSTSSS